MTQVVQAKCPHCKQVLRIPADWLCQPMRCKHCRQTFQARQKAPAAAPAAYPVAIPVNGMGIQAPVARPVAAVPARPVTPPPPRTIPVAMPAPASNPFAFDSSSEAGTSHSPFAFPQGDPAQVQAAAGPAALRRRGSGGWLKGALIGGCVLTITVVLLSIYGKQLLGPEARRSEKKKLKDAQVSLRDKEAKDNSRKGYYSPDKDRQGEGPKSGKRDKKTGDGEKKPTRTDKKRRPGRDKKPEDKPGPKKDNTGVKVPDPSKDKPPQKDGNPPPPKDGAKPPQKDGTKPPDKDPVKPPKKPAVEYFPRRALAISVNNYLFANPLAYGGGEASTGAVLDAFSRHLHFPNTQLVELSDGTIPAKAHAPLKPVIERTISDFLSASRPMDRVIVLFTGHAVEVKKAVYLVPMEGDLNDAKTLIPLSWVYERLVKSPARQKVLILDVCRLDPTRGQERQSTGAMTEAMDGLLSKPPEGIQVWTSCVAKQQSYDLFQGSLFLRALAGVLKNKAIKGIQDPADPLPLPLLQSKVADFIDMHLKAGKAKQTPRLAGKDPDKGAAYNADVELPPPQVILPAPGQKDGAASKAEIQGILDEIETIPPAKGLQGAPERLHIEVLPPFSAKVMAKYKADYASLQELDERLKANPKKFALIRAVRNATLALEKNAQEFTQVQAGRALPVPPAEKTRIIKYQEDVVGPVISRLEDALKDLKKAGDDRDKEKSKRWQANYDYVLVKLINRVIYLREYSLMLGKVRKDELPNLGPGDMGWRLVSSAKLSSTDKEIKELSDEVKEGLKSLKKSHAGTPWEILARRESGTYLGLAWRPNNK